MNNPRNLPSGVTDAQIEAHQADSISCESCETAIPDNEGHLTSDDVWLCASCYRQACEQYSPDEDHQDQQDQHDCMEDDQGRPINDKGETWIECDKCQGEGCYDVSESASSDWGEDICADAPDTIYTCSECRGACGHWVKFGDEK